MDRLVDDEQIIEVIKKHQGENMTVRNLMDLLGYYSTSSVHRRLKRLEMEGRIKIRRITTIEVI